MTEQEKRLSQNVPDALLYLPGKYAADVVVNRHFDQVKRIMGPECYQGRLLFVPDHGEPIYLKLASRRYPCTSSGAKSRAKAAVAESIEIHERDRARHDGQRGEVRIDMRSGTDRLSADFCEFGNLSYGPDGVIFHP